VTLKDAKGLQLNPFTTDDNGAFSFDVSGLTPPFILKAEWVSGSQTYTLFSAATGPGTANINPLTNLTLQLASNIDPSAVFGAQGALPDTSMISEATISAAQARMKDILTPLLAKYEITEFEPMRGPYRATPDNRLDAMLDAISITVMNNTLSITNKLDGSVIASGSVSGAVTLDLTRSPDSTVLTDIREITERVKVLCSAMNLGDALTVADLEDLFIPDQYYGTSSNHTRAEDMASIVTLFGPNGINTRGKLKTIRNVRIVRDQIANYSGRCVDKVYLLNFDFIHENGTVVHGTNCTYGKETSTGLWKFIGDPVNGNVGSNYGGQLTLVGGGSINTINIGTNYGSSTGTYNISGGSLTSGGSLFIGNHGSISGTGTFIQNGGAHIIGGGSTYIGANYGPTGTFNLNDGTLNGIGINGVIAQAGGDISTTGAVNIGINNGAGTFNLNRGTLTCGTLSIGHGSTFTISGGSLHVTAATLDSVLSLLTGGKFTWTAGAAGSITFDTQSGPLVLTRSGNAVPTYFAGVWTGSFSAPSAIEYSFTLSFGQNQDRTLNGRLTSGQVSGDLQNCLVGDTSIACGVRPTNGTGSTLLYMSKGDAGPMKVIIHMADENGVGIYTGTGVAAPAQSPNPGPPPQLPTIPNVP
jgi:hypothetical protein